MIVPNPQITAVVIVLFDLYLNYCVPFCFCQTRLVRELEKKFSGKHVVIVAQVCDFLHSCYFLVWLFFFFTDSV